ncbi:hypothetical protein jhhlp_001868 [Lomentospora prolificans]|uniref:Bacteriocin-protection protein n=1 Tax=Lomentospora prolificans TaxID=41688 RepID=A0A2N3NCG4_9PEZI|nr:hypothetical protein jhhlp_001868 [Lomentospora prolificans]
MPRQTRSATRSLVVQAPEAAPTPAINTTVTPPLAVPQKEKLSAASTKSLDILHFDSSATLEAWLETNHVTQTLGIWVKISKKSSGIPSVTYDELVDLALCYGWIDGQRKTHDENHFLQRFTPRRKRSMWSKRNVDRVHVLTKSGRVKPAGQAEIDAAKADGRWEQAYAGSSTIQVPPEFQAALDKNKKAKNFFETLGKSQRYSFLWRITTAKKAETRKKKIEQFIEMLANNETL